MNSPRPLRLIMVPLVGCLTLAASVTTPAAPAKKTPPPAPPVVEAPAPKRSLLNKLNPFQKKAAPPAPVPAPTPAPAKNSKKSAPAPAAAAPAVASSPSVKSTVEVKPVPGKAVPATPAAVTEETKKPGFFSRLKSKLNEDPEAVGVAEKPARPADWQERWVVTDESTAFYEFGPSQANGPDLRLLRGQVVKLNQSSRGWARVELEGGRQGYIGTDQMRQATERDFAPPPLPVASQLAAVGTKGKLPGWSPIAPPPDLPDLPMAAGMEDSLLLLPPLEFEGTELKKSSLRLKPLADPSLILKPGDALPPVTPVTPVTAPEPPTLELEKTNPVPAVPADPATPADPPLPAPAPPADPAPAAPSPSPADPS